MANQKPSRLPRTLLIVKIIAALLMAAGITYLTIGFHYFATIEKGVEYGIWQGFPLGFYFKGYRIDWGPTGKGPVAWNPIEYWRYQNLVVDYILYAIFTGGVLFLIDRGLKKLVAKMEKNNDTRS